MWSISRVQRKHFKLYLNPEVYMAFRLLCKRKGLRRVNHVVEAFMLASLQNPILLELTSNIAEKYSPNILHKPAEEERLMGKTRRMMDERKNPS